MDHPKNKFTNGVRYVILALSTICLSLVVSNSMAFNFTIICMRNTGKVEEGNEDGDPIDGFFGDFSNSSMANGSIIERNGAGILPPNTPIFSIVEEGWLFSAVAIGTLLGTIPITKITTKFGIRMMMTSYGLLSAFATLAVPFAVPYGFYALFAIRVLQGFAVATSYVAMGAICSEWSPLRQSGLFVSLISCHFQFGPMFTMPMAGELCESRWGWPAVYYVLGVVSLVFFTIFFLFFRDSPANHKNISQKELKCIREGKKHLCPNAVSDEPEQPRKVPYLAMVKDAAVWGIFVSNIGATFGNQIFVQYGPIYLSQVLKMNPEKTGISAALPFLLAALMKMTAGPLSDRLNFLSDKARVILFTGISQYVMAGLFTALVFLPASHPWLIQACFTCITMFAGLWQVGVVKSAQFMAKQHAPVIFSSNTFLSYAIVLVLPAIFGELVPDGTIDEWAKMFMLIAGSQVVSTTFFNFTTQVEARPWTLPVKSASKYQVHAIEATLEDGLKQKKEGKEGKENSATSTTFGYNRMK